MTRDGADRFLRRLVHSALAADAMMPLNFRNEADLTPEERERGERWRRWARELDSKHPPPGASPPSSSRPLGSPRNRSCAKRSCCCAGPGCSRKRHARRRSDEAAGL